jgi:hypothetical protein
MMPASRSRHLACILLTRSMAAPTTLMMTQATREKAPSKRSSEFSHLLAPAV